VTDPRRVVPYAPVSLLFAAACGYNFVVIDGLKAPCAEDQVFFTDRDGDGFGDPEGPNEVRCLGDESRFLTATNDDDCDDEDILNTARVGALCPRDLTGLAADAGGFGVARYDDSEFTSAIGDALTRTAQVAEGLCEAWAGADVAGDVSTARGGLASFDSALELTAAEDALDEAIGTTGDYAGFVGLRWSGSYVPGEWNGSAWTPGSWDASWGWEQPSTVTAVELPWCDGGSPGPAELLPHLNPEDGEQLELIQNEMARRRLAMIRTAGSWCVGLPSEDLDPKYSATTAHFVCERFAP
jgi:hypothetical protein